MEVYAQMDTLIQENDSLHQDLDHAEGQVAALDDENESLQRENEQLRDQYQKLDADLHVERQLTQTLQRRLREMMLHDGDNTAGSS